MFKLPPALIATCIAATSIYAAAPENQLLDEGIEALKARDLDTAIAKFTEAIKINPKNYIGYNDRGLAYKDKKDFAHAIADFTEAVRLKGDWSSYYNRAVAYDDKGDYDRAIADATKALKQRPKEALERADCLLLRAHAYFDKTNGQAAMSDVNAVLKLDQRRPDPYVLRGILYKVRHDYAKSLEDYDRAIGLDPTDPRSYDVEAYLLSVCPMPKYRNSKKAIEYATKACQLTEWKAADSLETLAAAYAEAGQFDDAVKWQMKAAGMDPKNTDGKRVALYQNKQPFRDMNRTEQPIVNLMNIKDPVAIKLGRQLTVRFDVQENDLVNPKASPGNGDKPITNVLWLDYEKDKGKYVLILGNGFARTIKGRCLARLKDYDTYFETDILPIRSKVAGRELWQEPIDELVLFDLKFE